MSNFSGSLYIISGPSGVGKTSLVKSLVSTEPNLNVAVSHTTRPPRRKEEDGNNYYFVNNNQFHLLISRGELLEYAEVFGYLYGTTYKSLQNSLERGASVILEIDYQGALQIKKKIPSAYSIFILPPSLEALKERLTARGQDTNQVINKRLQQAFIEMKESINYDHCLVNKTFSEALKELKKIFNVSDLG